MKNLIKICSVFFITGLLVSCEEDFLDAPAQSSLELSTIFSSVGLTQGAVDGILEPMAQTNSYRGRYIPYYGFNTDVEYNYAADSPGANADLVNYGAEPTNSTMNSDNNAWAMMYQGIERANLAIEGIRLFGEPEPGNEMGQLLGTALTYRAVYYADLMKGWGDVPARFEPITGETLYLPKTSRDTIYKRLIDDLAEASTLVPWPSATSTVESINKAFVKGLRARLAMVASGYQQYPDRAETLTEQIFLSGDPSDIGALTNGGDLIDFRKSAVMNVNINTSTFYNVAPARDFLRLDAATSSGSGSGLTINITIDRVTIYASSNNESSRLLYVRFVSNDVTVRNTLIAETASEGYADRSGIDETPTFSNNNYFNAPGFYDSSVHTYDQGNYTTLDPGFVDPSSGDFTITNQTLKDNNVGDPRWR